MGLGYIRGVVGCAGCHVERDVETGSHASLRGALDMDKISEKLRFFEEAGFQ